MPNRHIISAAMLSVLAFLPQAQAVNPAPDGCYPNFTTAEGCNALNALTTEGTQLLAGIRSFRIPRPTSTRELELERWLSTMRITTRQLAPGRGCSTPLASEHSRWD